MKKQTIKRPYNVARPGEISMKNWRDEEARRRGVTPNVIAQWLSLGKIPYPPHRRVNPRVVFVKVGLPKVKKGVPTDFTGLPMDPFEAAWE
jgi:hypothetical protein